MNQTLIDALRNLHPSGHKGFEGLVAELLEVLTGRHFYLAQSGTQLGRDMSASGSNADVIAVECKRYGSKTELDERELLGELVQVAKAIPDLALWVLIASRDIPSQIHESLRSTANDYSVVYLPISTGDGTPSSLEVLCAQAPDRVFAYLSEEDKDSVQQSLRKISKSAHFDQNVERLKNGFTSPLVGYNPWKVEQNRFFYNVFNLKQSLALNLEDK